MQLAAAGIRRIACLLQGVLRKALNLYLNMSQAMQGSCKEHILRMIGFSFTISQLRGDNNFIAAFDDTLHPPSIKCVGLAALA